MITVSTAKQKREVTIVEAVLEQAGIARSGFMKGRAGRVERVLRRVFGCWHRRMSLPFTRGGETYRTCVDCGARRRYDLEQWRMVGPFYRPGEVMRGEENETINCSRYDHNFGYRS